MVAAEIVAIRTVEAVAAVFDQCFGVFEIPVDGLDGGRDAVFLCGVAVSACVIWIQIGNASEGDDNTLRICSPITLALMIIR